MFECDNKEEFNEKIREISRKKNKVYEISYDIVHENCQNLMKIYIESKYIIKYKVCGIKYSNIVIAKP